MNFDISEDELPIFLSEASEHLQELDDILVRLERKEDDPQLLQEAFRAAHTLKGMAGMIGHKRMVQLTHSMETAFDCLRKNSLEVTTQLIDLCLEAVDGLRALNEEVVTRQPCDVNVEYVTERFGGLIQAGWVNTLETNLTPSSGHPLVIKNNTALQPTEQPVVDENRPVVMIHAVIAPDSIASAARAFQLMLALQDLGEVCNMHPSQEEIETAAPVRQFDAQLISAHSNEEIQKALQHISDIAELSIDAEPVTPAAQPAAQAASIPAAASTEEGVLNPPRLGDFLVKEHYINQAQLEEALRIQHQPGNEGLLGQVLVASGILPEETLNRAITALVQQQKAAPRTTVSADKMVRTSVERLDNLMNLMGEMITDRNRLSQIHARLDRDLRGNAQVTNLGETVAHLMRITDQLQEEVMRIRMVPISNVFNKFPRMVRDLAQKTGKDLDLVLRGQDTELDRSVIEEINDPLIHLLRNAVDHGIETPEKREAAGKPRRGTITLSARHEQNHIVLTVEDDGGGIDPGRIRAAAVQKGLISEQEAAALPDDKAVDLIFQSGFSTTQQVTEVSGRGVGMDIVRNNIQRINGSVSVDSTPGKGSCFLITLPLTLAIVPTLLVQVGATCFAVPLVMIIEIQRISKSELHSVNGKPVILLRNQVLPLLYLNQVFDIQESSAERDHIYIVVVRSGKQQAGLVVDALIGQEEVVVKALGALLVDIPGIPSAAILGSGQTALIVDVPTLFHISGVH